MFKHIHLKQCDSTQDELERHVEVDKDLESVLITTSKQINGRGRGAHTWEHLFGSLAFSFSAPAHSQLTWQSLEVAVCLALFFEEHFDSKLDLKWPNDIYSNGKKCGGILLKKTSSKMLIGIGLNLFPNSNWGNVLNDSISMNEDWKSKLPSEILGHYLKFHPADVTKIKNQWNDRCIHLNKLVSIEDGTTVTKGIFTGLGEHGQALVQTEKKLESIYNGTLRWQ